MGKKGFFLVIDGPDGCGKSLQSQRLYEYLQQKHQPVFLTSEPTSLDVGQLIRKYLKQDVPAALDALLFAADRVDHGHKILQPKIDAGYFIISDRYRDSSYVYQSVQGIKQGLTMDWIRTINQFSISPDLTIILDVDPAIGLQRKLQQRGFKKEEMEKFENTSFQQAIRAEFQRLVKESSPSKMWQIDANQDVETVFQSIRKIVDKLLD